MHQLASSILSICLSPFNWIIVLLVAAYFFRKAPLKKWCRLGALFILFAFGNEWLFNRYAKAWQPPPATLQNGQVFNCGIVPGGFASPDASANGYFNSSADRFVQTVKLFHMGTIKNILISGGNGKADEKTFREAAWVKGELMSSGIPDSVIFIEDKSNNTADNAKNAKQILDSINLIPPFLLITSALHMPRAALLFEQAGVAGLPNGVAEKWDAADHS